jgi:DNA-binding transcriptional LysR family regulator
MDRPKLDDLRVLAAIADHPSLTAAAAALEMPKQTVSRRVEALERAVGVRLVERTPQRMRLSEDGAVLAEAAREVVRLADEATAAARAAVLVPRGTLRLSTTHTVAERLLAPVVCAYLARYPEVDLELVLTERHVDLVEEGFDAVVRVGALGPSTLVATKLGAARLRYVASAAYLAARGCPATPDDLDAHDCLVHPLGPGETRWPFAVDGAVVARAVAGRLSVNSAEVVRAAARAGLGIALLAEPVCADDLADGALVPVLDAYVPDVGGIWLVTHGRRRLAARVRAFAELARASFR